MQDWLTLDRRPTLLFGAGGLGGACALSLAAQGARVALVDVNQDKLDAVVRAAKEAGCEIKPLVADLRTAEACRAAVREGVELVGTPQVFLHAIGRNERKAILDLGDADWEDTLSLNLSSAYWLGQAVGRNPVPRLVLDPRGDHCTGERVAAELEQRVVETERRDVQDLLPDLDHLLLERRARLPPPASRRSSHLIR